MDKKLLAQLQKSKTPCEFTWLDIVSKQRETIHKLNSISPTDMLGRFKIYGIVYKYDEYAVFIVNDIEDSEDDNAEMDCTAIPIHNIIHVKKLKGR